MTDQHEASVSSALRRSFGISFWIIQDCEFEQKDLDVEDCEEHPYDQNEGK